MYIFIAGKRCRFDRDYMPGEVVPANVVDPTRVKALMSYGILKMQEASEPVLTEQIQIEPVKTAPKAAPKAAKEAVPKKTRTTRKVSK